MRFARAHRERISALLVAGCMLFGGPGQAESEMPVDLELVLAVDVSRSMNDRELEIQRRGYVAALLAPDVLAAIGRGYHGQVALTYVEWAESSHQRVVVDWTLIRDKADAEAFAARLAPPLKSNLRLTSISSVIDFAAQSFDANGFAGERRVIDVSGDGPSNDGRSVVAARDDAVTRGVTINGLPLMTREGIGGNWYLDDLDAYYRHCVIGGRDAFVLPVRKWEDFPDAVRRKLLLELSGAPPPQRYAATTPRLWRAATRDDYDCKISDAVWGPPSWYRRGD